MKVPAISSPMPTKPSPIIPGKAKARACSNQAGKPICFYGPTNLVNFTKGLGNLFQKQTEDISKLKVGSEPPRKYLIQPPPGYQMPKVKDADDGRHRPLKIMGRICRKMISWMLARRTTISTRALRFQRVQL